MKERTAITEVRAQQNKVSFSMDAEYGDSAMGVDLGTRLSQYTLSQHSHNTLSQHPLSRRPIKTPSLYPLTTLSQHPQDILLTYPLHTLLRYPFNAPLRHPQNIYVSHTFKTPTQLSLNTNPLNTSSHLPSPIYSYNTLFRRHGG